MHLGGCRNISSVNSAFSFQSHLSSIALNNFVRGIWILNSHNCDMNYEPRDMGVVVEIIPLDFKILIALAQDTKNVSEI